MPTLLQTREGGGVNPTKVDQRLPADRLTSEVRAQRHKKKHHTERKKTAVGISYTFTPTFCVKLHVPLSTNAIAPSSMEMRSGAQPSRGRAFTKGRDSTGGSTVSTFGPKAAALSKEADGGRRGARGSI